MRGEPNEVAVIQRIFHEFVELGYSEYRIAEGLNADGIDRQEVERGEQVACLVG